MTTPKKTLPLWDRINTPIPNHTQGLSPAEIAKETRAHIKTVFPEIKAACTVVARKRVYVTIKSSPYGKTTEDRWSYGQTETVEVPGECLQAVIDYIDRWLWLYRNDNFDDYKNCCGWIDAGTAQLDYGYHATDPTPEQQADIAAFAVSKKEYDLKKEARGWAAYEERRKKQEELDRLMEEKQKKNLAAVKALEGAVLVEDIDPIYISDVITGSGKESTIEEVRASIARSGGHTIGAQVTRKITMTAEQFADFSRLLIYEFDFVAGMGGARTEDRRIDDLRQIYSLTKAERESIEIVLANCPALYVGRKLAAVIDPEGYNYCRYVYLPTDNTAVIPYIDYARLFEEE